MGEGSSPLQSSLAAPFIFFVVVAFHLLSRYMEVLKKRGSRSAAEIQLRIEIKQLLKEANSFSQPSTFAQAAKLRRMAAARERELEKNQELHSKDKNLSYDSYLKLLTIIKVFTYLVLIFWFWGIPVAIVSTQLVQPFGKLLSWRAGGHLTDKVMVGIIPWLILATRVSKYLSRKVFQ